MKQFLILILASGLMVACSGDSKEDAAGDDATPAVISQEDADAAAEAAMSTTEDANAELDKLAKELED